MSPHTLSSTLRSTSSCHGPRGQSFPRSRAACFVRTLLWTLLSPFSCRGLCSFDDPLSDAVGHNLILGKFHRVIRASLRCRAQVRRISEHLGERNIRTHDLSGWVFAHPLDDAAAAIQITNDFAHVVF